MSSSLVPVVALIAMLTIFWVKRLTHLLPDAVAFAASGQAVAPDKQLNNNRRDGGLQAIVKEVARTRRSADSFPLLDTVAGRPSNAVAKASGSGSTDLGVAVGQSVSAVGTALGGSARVNVTAVGSDANAGGVAIGGDAHAVGKAVGGSAQIILDGVNGGKASGQVYGGNANADGDAVGGDAIIGGSDDVPAGDQTVGGSAGVHSAEPSAGRQRNSDGPRGGLTSAATRWARTSTSEVAMLLSAWRFINCFLSRA